MKMTRIITLSIASLFAVQIANADTSGTSSKSITDVMNMSYYSAFEGPALSKFNTKQGTDDGTDGSSPIDFYNILSVGVKNSPIAKFQADFRFYYVPTENKGEPLRLADPRISWAIKNVVSGGGFTLRQIKIRNDLPLSKGAAKNKLESTPSLLLTAGYELPVKGLSLGLDTYTKGYTYGEGGGEKIQFLNGIYPSIAYEINDEFSVDATYANEMAVFNSKPGFNTISSYFMPRFNWTLSKNLTVSPSVLIHVLNGPKMNATQAYLELSGAIL